ncbi:MAG: VacB/RNase II family 3'-5' exoribonuclease, partial [Proteobacteria bacterium]|nr:VacB/RNase II family 3'-5' exoribonuclease [Pseudomonadota bacterium]
RPDDLTGRHDLRDLGLVTIDGRDARDFDDAVHVERTKSGWVLHVAIADVSNYVDLGSPLDREAYERGNSYYFPLSVEPMFPEKLSNGLCSLNPGVDRLAMVARIQFTRGGEPRETAFFPAVINSKARLTYGQVKLAVLDRDEETRASIAHVIGMLDTALELARALTEQRTRRGSLDFELPEAEVRIDDKGKVVSVRHKRMHYANRIIEEFMVAANEAVARYLAANGPACLYRIHPEADAEKLETLYKVLRKTGQSIQIPTETDVSALQGLISQVKGTDLEFLVNRMLLRCMKQARYSPEDEGHFGLASDCYCHFTSPIRRYADLVVHRLLKMSLGDTSLPVPGQGKLKDVADRLYVCERKAMEAEREMDRRVACLYLLDHLGEEFDGVLSSIAEYGFRVELQEIPVEGMVRLATLSDDYYAYFRDRELLVGERTGKAYRLGQKVRVKVQDVNLSALEVDFKLISGGRDYKEYV